MPYMRDGATKVSDHWVRSPLLNVNRACQTCHHQPEDEILARVDQIQQRNYDLMQRGGVAIVALLDAIKAAKRAGATDAQLQEAIFDFQRKAQWRLDFIAAENLGFHAPQEAAMVLGEALDYARQGELAARRLSLRCGVGASGTGEVDHRDRSSRASQAADYIFGAAPGLPHSARKPLDSCTMNAGESGHDREGRTRQAH
jgi:formate-dependent nitrite reductase cytochrome c552 subunit